MNEKTTIERIIDSHIYNPCGALATFIITLFAILIASVIFWGISVLLWDGAEPTPLTPRDHYQAICETLNYGPYKYNVVGLPDPDTLARNVLVQCELEEGGS